MAVEGRNPDAEVGKYWTPFGLKAGHEYFSGLLVPECLCQPEVIMSIRPIFRLFFWVRSYPPEGESI